jgi:EAL domain-containing protein (putative c-di-GMP-specific phosphodiesterase class I)
VEVNISALLLANPTLPEEIEAALQEAGVASGALIAEITEGAAIADPVLATEALTRLRIKGVRLSLNDFGTGHSSLLSLMRLPFNELKIDRSFVTVCETDPEAWKTIRATISVARELGLDVVAEGVESALVEERLIGAGCDIGQSWRFGRPMAGSAVEAWFEAYAGGGPCARAGVIYPMLAGICALPQVCNKESPQRHGVERPSDQLGILPRVSVPPW